MRGPSGGGGGVAERLCEPLCAEHPTHSGADCPGLPAAGGRSGAHQVAARALDDADKLRVAAARGVERGEVGPGPHVHKHPPLGHQRLCLRRGHRLEARAQEAGARGRPARRLTRVDALTLADPKSAAERTQRLL